VPEAFGLAENSIPAITRQEILHSKSLHPDRDAKDMSCSCGLLRRGFAADALFLL